jgi:serine/threonine-protein kinase RsbW
VEVIQLRVPGNLAYRNIALRAVSEACKMSQCDEVEPWSELEEHAVSAVGEAFNNLAIHGYAGIAPGLIDILLRWTASELVIQITDTGHTFDPGSMKPFDADELHESGMGLFIMKSFMDRVDYQPGPPNVLCMSKSRAPDSALEDRGSGVIGLASELLEPSTPLADGSDGKEGSTSRSDWGRKTLDSIGVGARAVGGSRRA